MAEKASLLTCYYLSGMDQTQQSIQLNSFSQSHTVTVLNYSAYKCMERFQTPLYGSRLPEFPPRYRITLHSIDGEIGTFWQTAATRGQTDEIKAAHNSLWVDLLAHSQAIVPLLYVCKGDFWPDKCVHLQASLIVTDHHSCSPQSLFFEYLCYNLWCYAKQYDDGGLRSCCLFLNHKSRRKPFLLRGGDL